MLHQSSCEKIQEVFESLQCAAKYYLALGFVQRNVEDGSYRYFYAHESSFFLERSLLIAKKEDLQEFQQRLDDLNIVELSTRERSSTKSKLLFTTNVTIFAALLKNVPVGCKDILLPPSVVKRSDVNCLTYKSNKERYNGKLCLLRAVCMHKTGNESMEEKTKKLFNSYITANEHLWVQNFRGVGLEDLHIVERLAELKILVYDIEVSDGGIIGALAERSLRPFISTATLEMEPPCMLCYWCEQGILIFLMFYMQYFFHKALQFSTKYAEVWRVGQKHLSEIRSSTSRISFWQTEGSRYRGARRWYAFQQFCSLWLRINLCEKQ